MAALIGADVVARKAAHPLREAVRQADTALVITVSIGLTRRTNEAERSTSAPPPVSSGGGLPAIVSGGKDGPPGVLGRDPLISSAAAPLSLGPELQPIRHIRTTGAGIFIFVL